MLQGNSERMLALLDHVINSPDGVALQQLEEADDILNTDIQIGRRVVNTCRPHHIMCKNLYVPLFNLYCISRVRYIFLAQI